MQTDTPPQSAAAQPPLRLTVPRQQAMREIQAAIKIGQAIADQRIRQRHELDDARAEKQEWTQRTTELLTHLFNSARIADRCNDWTARILPEFAPLEAFIELFTQEMDHRLGRLQAILRRLDDVPDSRQNAPAAPVQSSQKHTPSPAQTMTITPHPPASSASPAALQEPAMAGRCLLLNCGGDGAIEQAVRAFASKLGFELVGVRDGDGAESLQPLEEAGESDFAVVLAGSGEPASWLFKLGFCAGRLGASRVCVVHDGDAAAPANGLPAVAVDGGEGWQLQLARQIRRAGLLIDLNRLV